MDRSPPAVARGLPGGRAFPVSHAVLGHHAYLLGSARTRASSLLPRRPPREEHPRVPAPGRCRGLAGGDPEATAGNARLHWLTTAAAIVAGASAGASTSASATSSPPTRISSSGSPAPSGLRGAPRVCEGGRNGTGGARRPDPARAPSGYLSYFNLIAGGAQGGHRWLADSNLDWGQDLPRLAGWIRASGEPCVRLAYFGSDEPDHYGIRYDHLLLGPGDHPGHPVQCSPTAPWC